MLFETWYQTYFLLYDYCKYVFSQHFLNYNFHIILYNNIKNLQPNKLLGILHYKHFQLSLCLLP